MMQANTRIVAMRNTFLQETINDYLGTLKDHACKDQLTANRDEGQRRPMINAYEEEDQMADPYESAYCVRYVTRHHYDLVNQSAEDEMNFSNTRNDDSSDGEPWAGGARQDRPHESPQQRTEENSQEIKRKMMVPEAKKELLGAIVEKFKSKQKSRTSFRNRNQLPQRSSRKSRRRR